MRGSLADGIGGADRHGGFDHNGSRPVHELADRSRHGVARRQIGAAIGARWRSHRDEDDRPVRHAPPASVVKLSRPSLRLRRTIGSRSGSYIGTSPRGQHRDARRRRYRRRPRRCRLRRASRLHQPHIAAAEHRDFQAPAPSTGKCRSRLGACRRPASLLERLAMRILVTGGAGFIGAISWPTCSPTASSGSSSSTR